MAENNLQTLTKWTPEQVTYMHVLADPLEVRNDDDIAESLNVSRQTLWNWRQMDGFCDEAYGILVKNLSGKLGKVFAGLMKRASQGDSSAARLILEVIGKLKVQGTKEGDKTLNVYVGTPEQNALILEQEVLDVNEELSKGNLRIEDGRVTKIS